jgi:hypothetical protein
MLMTITDLGLGCSSVAGQSPSIREDLGSIPVPQKKRKEKKEKEGRCLWLTPIILATQEAEIRIAVQRQPWENSS